MVFTLVIGEESSKARGSAMSFRRISDLTGYTKSHVGRVLQGKSSASLKCMSKLAEVLGESIDDLNHNIKEGIYATANRR